MARRKSNGGRLVLDGPATVRDADALHAKLTDILQHHSEIEIDCAGVTEVDISLIQLLLAARKSALRAGKSVVLAAPAAGALREALSRGGFFPGIEDQASADEAFWLKGRDA